MEVLNQESTSRGGKNISFSKQISRLTHELQEVRWARPYSVHLERLNTELQGRRHVGIVMNQVGLHALQPLPRRSFSCAPARLIEAVAYASTMDDNHDQGRPWVRWRQIDISRCRREGDRWRDEFTVGLRGKEDVDIGLGQRYSSTGSVASNAIEKKDRPE